MRRGPCSEICRRCSWGTICAGRFDTGRSSECPVLLQWTPTTARPATTIKTLPSRRMRRLLRGEERKPVVTTALSILPPAGEMVAISGGRDRNLRGRIRHPRGDEPATAAALHLEEEVLRLE